MGHEERIRVEPCGCQSDVVTGLVVAFCCEHEAGERRYEAEGGGRCTGRPHLRLIVDWPYDWAERT